MVHHPSVADIVLGEPTNATKLLNMYAFDVMGDLAFGEPFDMLENMKQHCKSFVRLELDGKPVVI